MRATQPGFGVSREKGGESMAKRNKGKRKVGKAGFLSKRDAKRRFGKVTTKKYFG